MNGNERLLASHMHDGNPSKCDIFLLSDEHFRDVYGPHQPIIYPYKPLRLVAHISLPALINHHLGETGRVWVTPTWGVV